MDFRREEEDTAALLLSLQGVPSQSSSPTFRPIAAVMLVPMRCPLLYPCLRPCPSPYHGSPSLTRL
eukprot:1140862-Alexandrium_andersonii.AAC.1